MRSILNLPVMSMLFAGCFLQSCCKSVSKEITETETKEVVFTVLGSDDPDNTWKVNVMTEEQKETTLFAYENVDPKHRYALGEKLQIRKVRTFPIIIYKDGTQDTMRIDTRYWILR